MAKQKLGSFNDVTTVDDTYHIPSLKKNNNNFNILPSDLAKSQSIWHSGSTSITAFAGGGQASATQLTSEYNNVTVCATAADSIKALTGNVNSHFRVVNNGASACALYPKTGENFLGLAANTSISIPVGAEVDCFCYATGVWTYRIESMNFYIANGTLTGTRTVSQGGYNLIFSGATVTDYVGFGITPTAKVHIKGYDATSSYYGLKIDSSTTTNLLSVRNDGAVIIGNATPLGRLTINNTGSQDGLWVAETNVLRSKFGYQSGNGGMTYLYDESSNITIRFVGAAASCFIDNGQNVSIGTQTATKKLTVNAATSGQDGLRVEESGTLRALYGYQTTYGGVIYGYKTNGTSIGFRILSDNTGTTSFINNGESFIFGAETGSASAKVEITSTTQGFLPPRMTTAQRDAIGTPAAGLVVYNTTTAKLNLYTTVWEAITSV